MTALAQLYALHSHGARSFNQWQRALYPNFIVNCMSCAGYRDVIGHASHAIHYIGFSTLWRSAYRRSKFKAKSNIATTGWELEEDSGLLNMIIKPTLHSIHKFYHQWFHTPTATSFSLQIILSSSVARLTNLEKNFPINQQAFYSEILHLRILFS